MCLKSELQTVAKVTTWTTIGAAELFVATYAVTGRIEHAGATVGIYCLTKPVIYYCHEKLWSLSFVSRFFACR